MGIGFQELIIIFLIVLLLFGAKRLPEIARSLGKATTEFRKAKDEIVNAPIDTPQQNQQQIQQSQQQVPPPAQNA